MITTKVIRFLALFGPSLLISAPVVADSIEITATEIHQNPRQISSALKLKAAFRLTSDDVNFGGFSGLLVAGDRLTAVTDKGRILKARLTFDANGQLTGLAEADLTRLVNARGMALGKKKNSDAESLAWGEDGETMIAFERNHRLQQYPTDYPLPDVSGLPSGVENGPQNGGIEALARLADGRLVAIAEGPKDVPLNAKGWVSQGDIWLPFRFALNDRFRVTGATPLADGSLIVLERFYKKGEGLAARLRRIPGLDLAVGATVHGALLGELRAPDVPMGNYEGIAATPGPNGTTLLYVISDNNFIAGMDTLLLVFALKT